MLLGNRLYCNGIVLVIMVTSLRKLILTQKGRNLFIPIDNILIEVLL